MLGEGEKHQRFHLRKRGAATKEDADGTGEKCTWKSVLLQVHNTNHFLRCSSPWQPVAAAAAPEGAHEYKGADEGPSNSAPTPSTTKSVQTPVLWMKHSESLLAVQQIMTEINGAVS